RWRKLPLRVVALNESVLIVSSVFFQISEAEAEAITWEVAIGIKRHDEISVVCVPDCAVVVEAEIQVQPVSAGEPQNWNGIAVARTAGYYLALRLALSCAGRMIIQLTARGLWSVDRLGAPHILDIRHCIDGIVVSRPSGVGRT